MSAAKVKGMLDDTIRQAPPPITWPQQPKTAKSKRDKKSGITIIKARMATADDEAKIEALKAKVNVLQEAAAKTRQLLLDLSKDLASQAEAQGSVGYDHIHRLRQVTTFEPHDSVPNLHEYGHVDIVISTLRED